jgi:hypothetical protein
LDGSPTVPAVSPTTRLQDHSRLAGAFTINVESPIPNIDRTTDPEPMSAILMASGLFPDESGCGGERQTSNESGDEP